MLRNPGNHNAMSSSHEAERLFRDSNHDSVLMSRFDNPGSVNWPRTNRNYLVFPTQRKDRTNTSDAGADDFADVAYVQQLPRKTFHPQLTTNKSERM